MIGNFLLALSIVGDLVPNILLGAHFQHVYLNVFGNESAPFIWSVYNFVKAFALLVQGRWIGQVRRRTELLLCVMPILLTTSCLIWMPPGSFFASSSPLFDACVVFSLLTVHGLALNAFSLCRSTMFGQLDAAVRGRVAVVQQIFMVVSIVIAIALPPVVTDSWQSMSPLCALVCAVITVSCLSAVFFARNHFGNVPADGDNNNDKQRQKPLVETFWSALRDAPAFKHLLAAWLSSNLALSVLMSSLSLYHRLFFGSVSQAHVSMLQGGGQLGAALLTPIWLRARARLGTSRAWQISAFGFGSVLVCHLLADGSLLHLATLELVGAAFLSGLFVLPNLSVADVADSDAAAHGGVNRIGVFQSLVGFSLTLSSVLQGIISGAVLRVGGYDAQLDNQSASALVAVRSLISIVPSCLLVVSSIAIAKFSVSPKATAKHLVHSKEVKLD